MGILAGPSLPVCVLLRHQDNNIDNWELLAGPSLPVCVLLWHQDNNIDNWELLAGPSLPICVLLWHQDNNIDTWELIAGPFLPVCVLLRHQNKIKKTYGGLEVPAVPFVSALVVRSVEKHFEDWTFDTGSVRGGGSIVCIDFGEVGGRGDAAEYKTFIFFFPGEYVV